MRDSFFPLNLSDTPKANVSRELFQELSDLYEAVHALMEQIAYLRYGINRGVGQLAQNTIVDVQQTFSVKSPAVIGINTLVHLRGTPTGEYEAVVADSSQGLWANAYTVSGTANGKVDVKISNGLIPGFSGLVPGKIYYLSVSGTITGLPNSAHPLIQEVGVALDTVTLIWSFVPPIIN